MKNKFAWLVLGIVIGILVSIAACWFWCCCDKSCERSCREKCTVICLKQMDAVKMIPADTARAYFNCYMQHPDTVGVFKGFNLNLEVLNAMNLIAAADTNIKGFRIYMGVFGDPTDVGIVVGVNGSGDDNTSTIYTTPGTGVGPCPDVCDDESPVIKPGD
jgi:hypothetical protein